MAEQLIKSDPCGAVLVWLPQARPEQLRRLQVHAQSCDAPVFIVRPETALRDTSAASLRVSVALGAGWNASSWIKCHEPAAFLAALLNSQPLGFSKPTVQDARRHGVVVRSVDVMHSDVDCTLEDLLGKPAVRLGLRLITGLRATSATRIEEERAGAPLDNAEELARRCGLELHEMKLLAAADALA